MKFSPLPCYLVPLRPKYSPQHPILKHLQPTLLPHCQLPSFTPTQNNRQNYRKWNLNILFVYKILQDRNNESLNWENNQYRN
jgi:hypothetical protein